MKRAFMEQAATIGELRRGLVSGLRRRDSPKKWERGSVTEQGVIGGRKMRYERSNEAMSTGREGWEEQNRRVMDGK